MDKTWIKCPYCKVKFTLKEGELEKSKVLCIVCDKPIPLKGLTPNAGN